MTYLFRTPHYLLPILSGIGTNVQGAPQFVQSQEEQRYAQTVENQLYGMILMHEGGNGVITATYENVSTTIPIIKVTGVEAFIDKIYVSDRNTPFVFSGLTPGIFNYLFLEQIEQLSTKIYNVPGDPTGFNFGSLSSRNYGNAKEVIKSTPTVGPNQILLAGFLPDYAGYGLGGYGEGPYGHPGFSGGFYIRDFNLDPPGKIHLMSVAEHSSDNTDPHGPLWIQTQMQSSGVSVEGTLIAENVNVRHDLLVRGNSVLNSDLTLRTLDVQNLNVLGSSVFSGATLISSIEKDTSLTLDNLTVSRLQSGNGFTDGALVSRQTTTFGDLVTFRSGGLLGANLVLSSGVTIDGIDVSLFRTLTDGVEADFENGGVGHTHAKIGNVGLASQAKVKHLFFAPEFQNGLQSGTHPGTLLSLSQGTNNFYRWSATNLTGQSRLSIKQVVPEDFTMFSGVNLITRTSAGLANTSGVMFSLFDTNNALVRKQFVKRPGTNFAETRVLSGIQGTFTPGKMFKVDLDLFGEINQTVDLSEITASYFI